MANCGNHKCNGLHNCGSCGTKHGKWTTTDLSEDILICSNCGYETDLVPITNGFSYCPNCGAKMDLEEQGND